MIALLKALIVGIPQLVSLAFKLIELAEEYAIEKRDKKMIARIIKARDLCKSKLLKRRLSGGHHVEDFYNNLR